MECWFVHKKTPATSFFLITGAKILRLKMLHGIVIVDSTILFLKIKSSRKIKATQIGIKHSSEDLRLRLYVDITLHGTVQVIGVTREIGMHQMSEHLVNLAVGQWFSIDIH